MLSKVYGHVSSKYICITNDYLAKLIKVKNVPAQETVSLSKFDNRLFDNGL